jgi:hypothetical protein
MAYTDAQLAGFLRKCRAANRERETAPIEFSGPNLKCTPKTLSAEQMEHFEQVIRQQRIEREKGGWRGAAKCLEENFPEDFREPIAVLGAQPSCETGSPTNSPNSEPANEPPTGKLQPFANAPESPESALAALSAPSPIPLASAFWQSLLFGNPDALVSSSDATRAIALVSDKLGVVLIVETIERMRAGQLRKMLGERFGPNVWDVMNRLWRAAPASPDAPIPHEDQSHCSPGVRDCPRSMPAWRREFHQEVSNEQRMLEGIGGWPGS